MFHYWTWAKAQVQKLFQLYRIISAICWHTVNRDFRPRGVKGKSDCLHHQKIQKYNGWVFQCYFGAERLLGSANVYFFFFQLFFSRFDSLSLWLCCLKTGYTVHYTWRINWDKKYLLQLIRKRTEIQRKNRRTEWEWNTFLSRILDGKTISTMKYFLVFMTDNAELHID